MKKQERFIHDLVGDLKPTHQWLPSWRSAAWFSVAFLLNAVLMYFAQAYRPGFFQQLLEFPRFLTEILSAFFLSGFLIFWFFSNLVPGNKLRPALFIFGVVSALIFLVTLVLGFQMASPPKSPLGARPFCVEEVFVYGLLGIVSFLFILRKTHYKISIKNYVLLGVGAGLLPATLMQVACLYSPLHGLLLHYGPILVLVPLALLLAPFKKFIDRS
ncbi:DUF1109 family protein [bacterium]|nr:DUF1109 family protein [bacterium]